MEETVTKGADLEGFEKAVYGRKKEDRIAENDAALRAMHACLVQLREGAGFKGHGRLDTAQMTRFCSAVVALVLDPTFNFTQDGFEYLVSEKAVLETIFRASAYDGADYVLALIPEDEQHPTKYLPLFALNSAVEFDLEAVFRESPQATMGLYLSLLGYGQVVTPAGHARREKLLGMAHLFKDVNLSPPLWNLLCSAYMHCSYASGDHKHDCKRVFHEILANGLKDKVQLPNFGPQEAKARPTMLCAFEWWWSKHAMFRSYAHSIRQLRKRFRLVGCCAGKNTDAEARELFDDWIELDGENMNLPDVVKKVTDCAPDIIYYPSIGMAIWVIALASLRLAPIQVMSYGHPATSNSPVIDYGVIEEDCLVQACFSERMIGLPPNTVRPTAFSKVSIRHEPRKTDTVKIAVCAMQVKITQPFVKAMQEVQRRSKKKVELWFFSAAHGIGLYSLAKDLALQLENVWAQEQQTYEEYLKSVSECDIALFSIPFGGANSAYDCLTIGIPMVSLEGNQPHSRSDASIQRRAGLPADLITTSVEDYVNKVVELVDDDDKRYVVARLTGAVDLEGQFYQPDESGAFLKAFEHIYECSLSKAAA